MSIRRHMSTVRQYELIYITPPETTEEALAELHPQVAAVVERFGGDDREDRELGPPQAGLRDRRPSRGRVRARGHQRAGRADGRARSPPARVRHRHPPHDRARRRGTGRRRAGADAPQGATMATRRVRRGLPPEPTESERQPSRTRTTTTAMARTTGSATEVTDERHWTRTRGGGGRGGGSKDDKDKKGGRRGRSSGAGASASSASRRSTTSTTRT